MAHRVMGDESDFCTAPLSIFKMIAGGGRLYFDAKADGYSFDGCCAALRAVVEQRHWVL
jgi:hypothetical protein